MLSRGFKFFKWGLKGVCTVGFEAQKMLKYATRQAGRREGFNVINGSARVPCLVKSCSR